MDVTEKFVNIAVKLEKPFNAFFDVPYTEDEIYEQVKTFKCGKAPGPDYVCNEHIIYGGNTLLKWICYIFNTILKCEDIPLLYRHGIIIPLYKGNNKDKSNPNSYRAIVLTSFGFVPEHGAIPALYTLKECINVFMKSKSKLYVGFLDNEKAFDKIWHDGLFFEIERNRCNWKIMEYTFMSYKSASAHVQYNGLTSDNFSISQGVGQGDQFILDANAEHSITYNIITTLIKYDLFAFLETYVNEDYIPEKVLWSKIVRQSIEIYEENRWKSNLENRNELKRYSKIHPTLCGHRLIRLTVLYPDAKLELLVLVALGSTAIKKATCTLCNKESFDIIKHLIMECHVLLTERNVMFYKIVDEPSIPKYVDIFNLDDDDLLQVLLGAVNDTVYDLDPIDWSRMMYYIAKHVYPMFKKFRHVLFENRFNFEF
ncbi:unnamed protein product [Mytilus edulis]|uniref:Reverse transcriptase domain-containing protein n=1 Tax=Mytilus edulis TaxID=6550 RepID=A0A8S3Q769_MYTED|nr:unnamed protein product [Mytilus edulis]